MKYIAHRHLHSPQEGKMCRNGQFNYVCLETYIAMTSIVCERDANL